MEHERGSVLPETSPLEVSPTLDRPPKQINYEGSTTLERPQRWLTYEGRTTPGGLLPLKTKHSVHVGMLSTAEHPGKYMAHDIRPVSGPETADLSVRPLLLNEEPNINTCKSVLVQSVTNLIGTTGLLLSLRWVRHEGNTTIETPPTLNGDCNA